MPLSEPWRCTADEKQMKSTEKRFSQEKHFGLDKFNEKNIMN
jgi:hypothetical protein